MDLERALMKGLKVETVLNAIFVIAVRLSEDILKKRESCEPV